MIIDVGVRRQVSSKMGHGMDGAWNGRVMGGNDLNEDGRSGDDHGGAVIVKQLPSCGLWGI